MNIYKNNNITVHTIEAEDKVKCLILYSDQKCGLNQSTNETLRKIAVEEQMMIDVIEKRTIATEYIVLKESNQTIGYVCISRPKSDLYYINHIRIAPKITSEKYGVLLLDIIKKEALQDNCSIECNPKEEEEGMLIRAGFYRNEEGSYFISNKEINSSIGKNLVPIFTKYQDIEKEQNKKKTNKKLKKSINK